MLPAKIIFNPLKLKFLSGNCCHSCTFNNLFEMCYDFTNYLKANLSPSNIFLNVILLERFHHNCHAAFGH